MAKNQGKGTAADLAKMVIAGVQKHLATAELPIAGNTVTAPQIVAELQKLVDLRDAVEAARALSTSKVAAETAQAPALRAFLSAIVQAVRLAFGSQAEVLADFGLTPRKAPTPPTVEQRAAAAAKRAATRAARGTKSAKAKKAIHGAVTGVVVTPVLAPQPVVQAPPAPAVAPPAGTAAGGTTPHTA